MCEPLVIVGFRAASVGSNTITLEVTTNQPVECEAFYRVQDTGEFQSGGSSGSDPYFQFWRSLHVVPTPLDGGLSRNTNYELYAVCTNQYGASATTDIILVRTRR